jgi:hypothetical protein
MTEEIRHVQIDVPQEELDDLRRRVAAMRWPDRELVDDRSQGVQLAMIQALADHWATHDWRRVRETDLALRVPEMGLRRRDVRPRAVIDVDHF